MPAGYKFSEESRRKMSEAQLRRTNLRRVGEFSHTDESKAKISKAKRGKKIGPPTAETCQKISDGWSEESRQAASERRKGLRFNGKSSAVGFYINAGGYKTLTGMIGHPLSSRKNDVLEHRYVLYEKIGPGPHQCHYINEFGCGKSALEWGGHGGICVDHLDRNRQNNNPENLVPCCLSCNSKMAWRRGVL